MTQPRRDWSIANLKRELGHCLVCKTPKWRLELAHVVGREMDQYEADGTTKQGEPWMVLPDRVVLLCGPATDPTTCHGKHDAHRLDLVPYLTVGEVTQAIRDLAFGRDNGYIKVGLRICPGLFDSKVAA